MFAGNVVLGGWCGGRVGAVVAISGPSRVGSGEY